MFLIVITKDEDVPWRQQTEWCHNIMQGKFTLIWDLEVYVFVFGFKIFFLLYDEDNDVNKEKYARGTCISSDRSGR